MPTKTKIEWADYISNPLKARFGEKTGHACEKLSEGCAHCWASAFNVRLGTGLDYTLPNLEKVKFILDEKELERLLIFKPKGPFKNGRDRALVFPCDMTDLFGWWVPPIFIKRIFAVFEQRTDIDFLILTKRPDAMLAFLTGSLPLENVILGTSIENRRRANERAAAIDRLSQRGWQTAVSYEPALEPIYWDAWWFLNLVICGGESGNKARLMPPMAVRSARDFCIENHIPFFFKQWGEYAPVIDCLAAGMTTFKNRPVNVGAEMMVKVGKGMAGHLLDGVEWRQMP
jgi:protein gp37